MGLSESAMNEGHKMTPTTGLHTPDTSAPAAKAPVHAPKKAAHGPSAFGCPRNYLENRFVYTVISARA